MELLTCLLQKTDEILSILTNKELSPEEQIEELLLEGYDYDDIVELALLLEDVKKNKNRGLHPLGG